MASQIIDALGHLQTPQMLNPSAVTQILPLISGPIDTTTGYVGSPVWEMPLVWRRGAFVRLSSGTWQTNVTGNPATATSYISCTLEPDAINDNPWSFFQNNAGPGGGILIPSYTCSPILYIQVVCAGLSAGATMEAFMLPGFW